jgi:hypothetical protein
MQDLHRSNRGLALCGNKTGCWCAYRPSLHPTPPHLSLTLSYFVQVDLTAGRRVTTLQEQHAQEAAAARELSDTAAAAGG